MNRDQTLELLLDVVKAGVDMRVAQTIYFRNGRTTQALIDSKNAEKLFDGLAARALSQINQQQAPQGDPREF